MIPQGKFVALRIQIDKKLGSELGFKQGNEQMGTHYG